MTRKAQLFLLAGVALGFGIAIYGTKNVALAQPQDEKAESKPGGPPDLAEDVRVRFASPQMSGNFTGDRESPVVVRVEGNWVYLRGELYTGGQSTQLKLAEAWVNFDTVIWYKVVDR